MSIVAHNLRVIFFVYRLDDYSGAAKQALKLAIKLKGHADVEILNFQASGIVGESCIDGIRVRHVPSSFPKKLFFLLTVFSKRQCDLIHLHGYFTLPLFLSWIFRTKTYLKTTLLGDDDFESILGKRFGWVRLFLVRSIDLNNALTERVRRINERYLPSNKVIVIPNGVDVTDDSMECSKDFASPLFVFVGAVVRRKRPDLAIKYFIENYASVPGARLYVIGPMGMGLAEEDANYERACLSLVNGYESRIVFTGSLLPEAVRDYYRAAVALLFFSDSEGMPNVVLEAMAWNCVPITGSLNGLASEIVDDGASGFIVDIGCRKISLEEIKKISQAGTPRAVVSDRFSMRRNMSENLGAYFKLLGGVKE